MANVYALRIHELADDSRRRVVALCESSGGSYVVARETDATRTHFQGWVRTDVKPQAFRARIKKAFPECVGNKGYSCATVRDFESYSRYILKGTKHAFAEVVCYSGLQVTEEYLASEHRAYWSKAEKPGKSNRSLLEEVHEWTVEKMKDEEVSRRDIARRVCETLAARKRPINTFYVRGLSNTVQWLVDLQAREIILDDCMKH